MTTISQKIFGTLRDGRQADLFTLSNQNGIQVDITNYGAAIVAVRMPDKFGVVADVVLGFDYLRDYEQQDSQMGVVCGRVANRIGGAAFVLNNKQYELVKNDGENHIHGGLEGFGKKLWDAQLLQNPAGVRLTYLSPDGEEGYPGNLTATVTYTLDTENNLRIDYGAQSDADTIINLTNHSYFNLSGEGSGDILEHRMRIYASRYAIIDAHSLPTGELASVEGTPLDFRSLYPLGERMGQEHFQLQNAHGYDHCYVLDNKGKELVLAAETVDNTTGRILSTYTNKPGVQLYTANFLNSKAGKNGRGYGKYSGFCLETQFFPNAMMHPHFPSPILRAGEQYDYSTIYRFDICGR